MILPGVQVHRSPVCTVDIDEYLAVRNDGGIQLPFEDFLRCTDQAELHSVSILVGGDARGSATLASIRGRFGLLTAKHVWENEIAKVTDRFRVARSDGISWQCPVEGCNPTIVGSPENERPDLAFIELSERERFAIAKLGRFYTVRPNKLGMLGKHAIQHMRVRIFGTLVSEDENKPSIQPDSVHSFKGEADRVTFWTEEGSWDYLQIRLRAGQSGYPSNYRGMSGGSSWTVASEIDDKGSVVSSQLLLLGVTIEQTPPSGGVCQIHQHGPRSIYSGLVSAIPSRAMPA